MADEVFDKATLLIITGGGDYEFFNRVSGGWEGLLTIESPCTGEFDSKKHTLRKLKVSHGFVTELEVEPIKEAESAVSSG